MRRVGSSNDKKTVPAPDIVEERRPQTYLNEPSRSNRPSQQRPLVSDFPTTIDEQRKNASIPKSAVSTQFPELEVTSGNDFGSHFQLLSPETSIGRGLDNQIILTDLSVSRKHLLIQKVENSFVVIDKQSGNGTLLNGREIPGQTTLKNGDVLEIGNTLMQFNWPHAPMKLPPPTLAKPSPIPNRISNPNSMTVDGYDSQNVPLVPAKKNSNKPNIPGYVPGLSHSDLEDEEEPTHFYDPIPAPRHKNISEDVAPTFLPSSPAHWSELDDVGSQVKDIDDLKGIVELEPSAPIKQVKKTIAAYPPPQGNAGSFKDVIRKQQEPTSKPSIPSELFKVGAPDPVGFAHTQQSSPQIPYPKGGQTVGYAVAEPPSAFEPAPLEAYNEPAPQNNYVAPPTKRERPAPAPMPATISPGHHGRTSPVAVPSPVRKKTYSSKNNLFMIAAITGAAIVLFLLAFAVNYLYEKNKAQDSTMAKVESLEGSQVDVEKAQTNGTKNTLPKKTTVKKVKANKKSSSSKANQGNATRKSSSRSTGSRAQNKNAEAKALALYKEGSFSEAAFLLRNASDNIDDDDIADEYLDSASAFAKIGNLLSAARSTTTSNPSAALKAYKQALMRDRKIGGAHTEMIETQIADVAPNVARSKMAAKDYSGAKTAAQDAIDYGSGNEVRSVISSLSRKAKKNITMAEEAADDGDITEARRLYKGAMKMVPSSSNLFSMAEDGLDQL